MTNSFSRFLITTALILAASTVGYSQVPGYGYGRAITIDHRQVQGSDQSNFPVLIAGTFPFLATTANGGHVQSSSGYDIVFTSDAAGQNRLDHEIDNYDPTTGKAGFWVRMPTLSHTSDTSLYVWYGNSSVTTSQENKAGVWSSGYSGVWHLPGTSGANANDSTSNGNNLTNVGSTPTTTAEIGAGVSLNGSSQYFDSPSSSSLQPATAMTLSAWVKLSATQSARSFLANWDESPRSGYFIGLSDTTNNKIKSGFAYGTGSSYYLLESNTILSNNQWYFVTFTYDGSSGKIYVNGALDNSSSITTNPGYLATNRLHLGTIYYNHCCTTQYFNGTLDESRVSNVARSSDWIGTEYKNQSSPGTFAYVSPTEYVGTQPSAFNIRPAATSYSYARAVTIDHRQVANSDQTDFPVLISGVFPFLATVANSGRLQSTSGFDLVFTADSAGQTQLDYEIDNYDPATGTAAFWVRIPTLSHTTDTQIYMWYGNSSIAAVSQQNKSGVWQNNYAGVWHFGTGSSLATSDSTANGRNGTNVGASAAAGVFGGAASVNGNYIDVGNMGATPTRGTVSMWVKSAALANYPNAFQTGPASGTCGNTGIRLELAATGSFSVASGDSACNLGGASFTTQFTAGAWHYVVTNWDTTANTLSATYDGGFRQTVSNSYWPANFDAVRIGVGFGTSRYWNGQIDEVRMSTVSRSPDWVTTEYNNQTSPSTFSYASPTEYAGTSPSPYALTFSPSSFSYRRAFTIDHRLVSTSDQTDFPVLVSGTLSTLKSTGNGGNVQNANGYDIVFSADPTGQTQLDQELDSYNAATGAFAVWVRIPTLSHSTDTTIYMWYGNSQVAVPQDNKTGLWRNGYSGVWHFGNGTTLNSADSTLNTRPGVIHGATAAAGQIGGSASFASSSSNYIDVGNMGAMPAQGTVSMWLKAPTLSSYPNPFQTGPSSGSCNNVGIRLEMAGGLMASDSGNSGCGIGGATITSQFTTNTWHSVVTNWDTSANTLAVTYDGGPRQTVSDIYWPTNFDGVRIGVGFGTSRFWNGQIDEVRMSTVSRSAAWNATEYNNQTSGSFMSSGSEYLVGAGAGAIQVSPATLPAALQNAFYGATLTASGGTAPYSWSVVSGSLPSGMSLNASTGKISGTPAMTGVSNFSVRVTDASSLSTTVNFSLTVAIPNGYSYTRAIRIDHTKIPNTDQQNFPVLITGVFPYLATQANGGNVTSGSGYDIIFTSDATGQNKLDHEIDAYDPATGTASFWVRVPWLSSSTDTFVFMWYGNSQVTTSQENKNSIWANAHYATVYHLGSSTALNVSDSTANGNTLTNVGTVTAAAGEITGAASVGASKYLVKSSPASLPGGGSPRTMELWFRFSSLPTSDVEIAGYGANSGNGDRWGLWYSASGSLGIETQAYWIGFSWTADTNWHHVVTMLTTDCTTLSCTQIYLDGVNKTLTTSNGSTAVATNVQELRLNGVPTFTGGDYITGLIDEFRIASIAETSDWVTTEYNNQASPATFSSIGFEQSATPRALTITTTSLPNGIQNVAYSAMINPTGGTLPYSLSIVSGTLQTGLSFNPLNGTISGTPTVYGSNSITFQVTDGFGTVATQTLTLPIYAPIAVSTTSLRVGTQNASYSATLTQTGGLGPYSWSIASGSLPAGLSLSSAGVISGTPTGTGTANFTVQVTDAMASVATKALAIAINGAVSITTTSLPPSTQNASYSTTLAASNGTAPLTWSISSGSLPAGLSFSSAGVISGTPTSNGASTFTVQVADVNSSTATQSLTLTTYPALTIQTSFPDATQSAGYEFPLSATGGMVPYTWSISSGSLPAGLTLNAANAAISGTPTAAGSSNFTLQVVDADGVTTARAYTFNVNSPVAISTTSLNNGMQYTAYNATLVATSGTPPYSWTLTSGTLPLGMSFSRSTGVISGTPSLTGTNYFTVVATDANGSTASQSLSIAVQQQSTVITLTDSLGRQTTYTSDVVGAAWRLSSGSGTGCSSCTSRGNVQNTYDTNGNVLTTTDALSHVTTYAYDAANNMTSQSQQLDTSTTAITSYTYNSFGEPLTVTDALGHTTTNTYDTHGNLLTITTPAPDGSTPASVTQFGYDTKGQLTSITDPLNHVTNMTYTAAGYIQTITDPQQHTTTYEYDARGNRTAVVDAAQNRTTFAYDLMNRLTQITYPDTTTMSFGYDHRGRRTSVTDQNSRVTQYAYDNADRLTSVTDAAGHTTQYGYDTESNLTSITDANSHTTQFAYDAMGRVTQTTFPSTQTESYGYDAIGNLTSKTDRKSQTIQYVYDPLNRLTHKGYPDSTGVDYVYDLVGKIQQASDPTGTYGFAYDNMGRLIGTTTQYAFLTGTTFSQSYAYDKASNRTSATMPDGSTNTYAYDSANRLTDLTSSWSGHFTFGYDQLNRSTSLNRPNGVNSSYSYDNVSRLLSVLHQVGSTTIDGASYGYDSAGNRTSKTNQMNGVGESYSYDLIYQLTQVLQAGTATESYSYDNVGNRLSSLSLSPYAYNSSNQLTSTPSATYAYDYNGNTTSKTDTNGTTQFAWDFENRLTSVTLPGSSGTVTFKYDPFGRRIQKYGALGITNYVYDGANIVAEYSSGGALLAKYTQGSGIDQPLSMSRGGTTAYYSADGLGSITSMEDGTGSAVAAYTYDAFGRITSPPATLLNPFQYTGREWDSETSLYYYRARYYDQQLGRFLSEDPLQFLGGENFFDYTLNSPIGHADPSGLETEIIIWGPVGHGESAFGHASVRINGTSYSWGPVQGQSIPKRACCAKGKMDIRPASDFISTQVQFRSGTGYIIKLTPSQEAQFQAYLANYSGTYWLGDNCQDPIVQGLHHIGVFPWLYTQSATPHELERELHDSKLIGSTVPHAKVR